MQQKRNRILALLLSAALFFSVLPAPVSAAGYETGYGGGSAGDGNGIYAFGVDVSSWQGGEVDFAQIKAQGIDYVILRAGFATTEDKWFEENYARAKAAGLDVGVYLYSYAGTTEAAAAEAAALKTWLSGKLLEYPVYYDIEDPEIHAPMSSEALTELILTFLDSMAADGWLTGLYSSINWLENQIDIQTVCERYECWMALYYDNTYERYDRYDDRYGMWQYSASGTVDGIPDNADMDICFKDYPTICRQYGFNGYSATGETVLLNGASVPSVLAVGDEFSLTGRVASTDGNLYYVSAGIYTEDGQFIAGDSASPNKMSFDLSEFSASIRPQELAAGRYELRVDAQNAVETRRLVKQSLVISACGVRLDDAESPENAKEGEPFSPSGLITASTEINAVSIRICDDSGTAQRAAYASPHAATYDLSTLSAALQAGTLPVGSYTYRVAVETERGDETLLNVPFARYVRDDPVTLTDFALRTEYLCGELTDLSGVVTSSKSVLQSVTVTLSGRNGEVVASTTRQKRQVVLAEFRQTLRLGELSAGTYTLRIDAFNAGGPVTLAEQTFLIRADAISLCEFNAPDVLYEGDTFLLDGMIASDHSPLSFVGVRVTDASEQIVLDAAAVPQDRRYDLRDLSPSLLFSTLPEGEYELRITARNEQSFQTLYAEEFTVTRSRDKVAWEDGHASLYGMSYYAGDPVVLWGTLVSEQSALEGVKAEIWDETGILVEYASLNVEGNTASIQPFNEALRFSALSEGNYRLKILAQNASGEYTMLSQSFSVIDCPHRNVISGEVLPASCDRRGVICDSRCLRCGGKIRGGSILAEEAHTYHDGSCTVCGRAVYKAVPVSKRETLPDAAGRCVLATEYDGLWYALGANAEAVPIGGPDGSGRFRVSAELLWTPQVIDRETDAFCLTNAQGNRLHLDSGRLAVGGGTVNTALLLDGSKLSAADAPSRCVQFDGVSFDVGETAAGFSVFVYPAS